MTGARPGQALMGRFMGRLVEPLLDALTDPSRRERTVVAVLMAYVGLWTLYGTLAKGSQDIHSDMSEQFALSRELAWGYPKHPPLGMAIVRVWFAVFPAADWAYYLLAMVTAGLALWIAWRLSARFLDGEKRVVGLALLTLVPFFNFHALKFNQNTVLLPLWAATTLWFLRSFETRRLARCGAGRARCRGLHVRQVLVDRAADRARRRRARRPQARGLFPLGRALGDDRGRGARARAACGLADRQRFRAVLLCRRRARGGFGRVHLAGRVRLPRRQRRLCRGSAAARLPGGAAEPRGRRRHGVAGRRGAPAGGDRVLGDLAAAGLGRAAHRGPAGVALVHVGLYAVAGDAAVVAARRRQPA